MTALLEKCKPYFKLLPAAALAPSGAWAVPALCAAYNWPTGLSGGGVIGIVELDGGWVQADMTAYFASVGQPMPQITDVSVNGVTNNPNQHLGNPRDPDFEVALDIQVAAAAYYVATGKPAVIRVYWADDIAPGLAQATADGVDVFSISWGNNEAAWIKFGQQEGRDFIKEMEDTAQAATNAGVVVFAAAGDNDSGDQGPGAANVDVPASCPHVIGCGGTKLTLTGETVWNETPGNAHGIGTGGGYSRYFPMQSFQSGAPHGPGRMVPDVAGNADRTTGYEIYVHGADAVVGGTSAVAPLYAGLFAAFGTRLGFVSPKLWDNHLCFNDITVGDNGHYRARIGPDPCTGIGSPIGTKLAQLFVSPAAPHAARTARKTVAHSYLHLGAVGPSAHPFIPFRQFVNSLHQATHASVLALPGARVGSPEQFERMRSHVARLYEGVEVTHSFVDENGQVFDCVPIEQQPSLRQSGARPASPPPDLPGRPAAAAAGGLIPLQPQADCSRKDAFGNTRGCPPGTIPMRRITLEEMARFETFDQFFRKTPRGKGRHPRLSAPHADALIHKYAHAYQVVNNLGGHNFLNVWSPSVVGPDQVFSLSQHWYAGGSDGNLQTAEVGWQVYPTKYGNSNPALFIYWTADDYGSTGCYNLDCHAFVQTNPSWTFGGSLAPVSTLGGQQYALEVAFFLYQNNWWLYLKGTDAASAVGYYPASLYGGGQMATCATNIDYGGETVAGSSWPPMGSGQFAAAGWQHAAYDQDIYYFPTAGGYQPATLIPQQPSPHSYTLATFSAMPPWNQYFFFGGPGGAID